MTGLRRFPGDVASFQTSLTATELELTLGRGAELYQHAPVTVAVYRPEGLRAASTVVDVAQRPTYLRWVVTADGSVP